MPKPSGIKAMLHPKLPEIKTVEDCSLDEIYSHVEGTLGDIEKKILDSEKGIQEIDEKIEHISTDIDSLTYLKDFDIDVSDIGTSDYVIVKAGRTSDLQALKTEINKLDKATIYSKQFGKGKQIKWSALIAAHILEEDKIEKICREKITEFDLGDLTGSPEKALKSLKKEKRNIEEEKKQIISNLHVSAEEQLHDLLALREQIKLERIRKEISKNFAKTQSTYVIKGWALEKKENELQKLVSNVSKDHVLCDFEKPSPNPDNPPTYIEIPSGQDRLKPFLDCLQPQSTMK